MNNSLIYLTSVDLIITALLILLLISLSSYLKLGVAIQLTIAAIRTTVQLLLVGLILEAVFRQAQLHWTVLIAAVMLTVAAFEVLARQKLKLKRVWGFSISALAMLISSFLITVLALVVVIDADPWYTPRYAIPLLGMLLGNTMTGIALGIDRLVQTAWQQRAIIEQRLMLGEKDVDAIRDITRDAMRAGMIPIINAMAAAGIVSLPGMMTGQILAGSPPVEAVKYQILIMFTVTAGTGFGVIAILQIITRRMFDERERLRFDRLLLKSS
jgi:putative ABC transport system permease protein